MQAVDKALLHLCPSDGCEVLTNDVAVSIVRVAGHTRLVRRSSIFQTRNGRISRLACTTLLSKTKID